ncbi:MAG: hypothetical protein UR68_C0005G0009 [Candidatus Roizmanbacteria bacterium GW2011_GWA2_35_19]|uniref:Uncharacterized protein n=2 Tax=Candidatus Roizmaniibacteriota TaxID=1752723 RepID=A0A0G0EDF6_9BACT|nr:MAG: hypothetical protein UR63_C0028G0009 [Candidatus Roizmanbacteria bacterium GW2011_GWC2_35_12]KKP73275.1 MAG: hypothetical protein UR68_C0005G0009 [Candidatus Roizmanbacteria bacterium GW2011_GWA2_35_19]
MKTPKLVIKKNKIDDTKLMITIFLKVISFFIDLPRKKIIIKLIYTYGIVLWIPKNISEMTIANKGIKTESLLLNCNPEKIASPPIGVKFGECGISLAKTANKIIAKYEINFWVLDFVIWI